MVEQVNTIEELWSDIPNFSRYRISNVGRVWNAVFERMMRSSLSTTGHLKISLIDNDDIRRTVSVAGLVAQSFVEPPNHRADEVILKDGNLTNVAAYNLAWRTHSVAYQYARQLRTPQPLYYHNLRVLNQTLGVEYYNIIEAGMTEGEIFHDIWLSTHNGKRVYPYGYTYEIVGRV